MWKRLPTLSMALLLAACGGAEAPSPESSAASAADRAALLDRLSERSNAARLEQNPQRNVPYVEGYDVERFRVDIDDAPRLGASEPSVVIVTFSDFECPFCARAVPTLRRLLEDYPQDVQLVFRNNPLPMHRGAMPAAEAALEAYRQGGDALFWRYHDVLFENQRQLERTDLERYGEQLGMDMTRLRAALDQGTHQPLIRADQEATSRLGARGTPAFFINGRQLMGAQPYEQFQRVVEEEVALARSDMARGVARSALYAHRMEGARTSAPPAQPSAPSPPTERRQPDPAAVYRVPIQGRPVQGRADALVTIVMFSDYQCPFCSRVLPTLDRVTQQYGSDVRFVFMHNPLPFHDRAMPAAQAAEEVFAQGGADAFFRYSQLLFDNQRDLTRENLIRFAGQVGVSRHHIERALDQNAHRSDIEAQQRLTQSLGASGTPTFFINGRNLRGAQPFPAFEAMIDEEMARAREMISSGTPRAQVYEARTRNGATTAQTIDAPAPAPRPGAPDPDRIYAIAPPSNVPTRGPATAPVTIQIFSDFQCPFCSRVNPTLTQLRDHYGSQVRWVWHDYPLPFHQDAMPAAEVGREVFRQGGSDAFWRYHDLAFANQRALSTDELIHYAEQSGMVDGRRVRRALESHTHRAAVEADMQSVADAGMRIGTPSFLINGRLLQGAQPFAAFQSAVDRALNEP